MIYTTINGKEYILQCSPADRLLDVLRDQLKFTGVKEGCGEGECGACSVIIDGKLCNSCLVAAGSVNGSKITTIEGLKGTRRFQVLDDAFADAGAVQCGFCTPGFVMSATVLLEQGKELTREEIKKKMSGNLCRCTGYQNIVNAVEKVMHENAEHE